jgi:hypothetical protein
MENSLYYTFSTISQVLAAFIALSGVFVIFKIQELKKMMFLQVQYFYNYLNGVKGILIGSFHDCPTIAVELKTLHKSECIGGMLEEMDKILENEHVKVAFELKSLKRMRDVFQHIDKRRRQLILLTKASIVSGILTIFLSIVVLTLVPNINCSQTIYFYSVGIVGTFICVMTMSITIFKSFNERNLMKIESASS